MEIQLPTRHIYRGEVTAKEIDKAYCNAFGVSWWQKLFGLTKIALADQTYTEADFDIISEVLAKDMTDKMVYSLDEDGNPIEDFNCDDFVFALMGAFHQDRRTAAMPIFITWISTEMGGHAVISFYLDGIVTIIEAQNDKMLDISEDWGLILLCG